MGGFSLLVDLISMKDPTRIPALIDLLHTAWEGQADLTLAQLWGVLESRGVGWGSTDEDVAKVLQSLIDAHPARIYSGQLEDQLAILDTVAPRRRITLDSRDRRVSVRDFSGQIRPATWTGATIKTLVVNAPAVVTDSAGIDHRLGVVETLRVVAHPETIDLAGRLRRDMGDDVYGVTVNDGGTDTLVIIGHGVEVHRRRQRTVDTENYVLEEITSCAQGSELRVRVQGRSGALELGLVEELFVLEL